MLRKLIVFFVTLYAITVVAKTPLLQDLEISQPPFLSAASPTILHISVISDHACTIPWELIAESDDEVMQKSMTGTQTLTEGCNIWKMEVSQDLFLPFALYEDITLIFRAGDQETVLESTLIPETASLTTSLWSIHFASKPALIYTTFDRLLYFHVNNPKSVAKTGTIKLKFGDSRWKKKVKMIPVRFTLTPGMNEVSINIPASIAAQAKAYGDTQVKAVLKVAGIIRATDTALVDYDLLLTSFADPVTGNVPLTVEFLANGSGGNPPYSFSWDFGDGSNSIEQNPNHTYEEVGNYTATVTMVDGIAGIVSFDHSISVGSYQLTLTCSAVIP